MNSDTSQVPSDLSERSQKLWVEIVPRRAQSAERLALLEQGLRALDRADECARLVNTNGLTTTTATTKAVHVHPLLRVEREQRQLFTRIWAELGLSWCQGVD